MKKTLYKTFACAAVMALSINTTAAHASIEDEQKHSNMTCKMIEDQGKQAHMFYKTALRAAYQASSAEILIPVGHFTTYVDANQAVNISEARMKQMAKLGVQQGCSSSRQTLAFHN